MSNNTTTAMTIINVLFMLHLRHSLRINISKAVHLSCFKDQQIRSNLALVNFILLNPPVFVPKNNYIISINVNNLTFIITLACSSQARSNIASICVKDRRSSQRRRFFAYRIYIIVHNSERLTAKIIHSPLQEDS